MCKITKIMPNSYNQSVLVVIYAESTHRILMLQRQDDPSFWQSVTGTLETNETPRETAIREVWEEVGLKIEENSTALFDCKESIEFEIFPHFRYKYAPNAVSYTHLDVYKRQDLKEL